MTKVLKYDPAKVESVKTQLADPTTTTIKFGKKSYFKTSPVIKNLIKQPETYSGLLSAMDIPAAPEKSQVQPQIQPQAPQKNIYDLAGISTKGAFKDKLQEILTNKLSAQNKNLLGAKQ